MPGHGQSWYPVPGIAPPGVLSPKPLRLVALALLLACAMPVLAADAIRACGSSIEYPPYLYTPGPSVQDAGAVAGVSVDLLQELMRQSGRPPAVVQRFPWKRCLLMAEEGRVDIVLNVPTAQIDPAPFLISEPYATLHSVYYVSRQRWPDGIEINDLGQLKAFRVCGLIGNRYESYDLRVETVDRSYGYESMIAKLHAGRCDMFIEKKEVMAALMQQDRRLRDLLTAPSISVRPLPEGSPVWLHFAVSRQAPGAGALLEQINAGIARLVRTGKIDQWHVDHTHAAGKDGGR